MFSSWLTERSDARAHYLLLSVGAVLGPNWESRSRLCDLSCHESPSDFDRTAFQLRRPRRELRDQNRASRYCSPDVCCAAEIDVLTVVLIRMCLKNGPMCLNGG